MAMRRSKEAVLAGDIGGTNARLRLCDRTGRRIIDEVVRPSARAPSLAAILRDYLQSQEVRVVAAVLGIAGPVIDGVVRTTNLRWTVDQKKLARELGIPKLALVNDLAAGAIGCFHSPPSERIVIARGRGTPGGNIAVLAAGTGLGEALLIWDGQKYLPCATEGGHADFAPQSEVERDFFSYVRRRDRLHHVSYERALSGPGLGRLYDFFAGRRGKEAPAVLRRLAQGDRNAAIAALGLAGKSRAAADAVELFARIYGAEAGNLVLKSFALGGVFLCGDIAKTLVSRKKTAFLAGLRDKGRMEDLLLRVPVTVVKDRFVGLTGAGHLAARLAAE